MSKRFKYKDNNYLDSTGIVHNKVLLNEVLGTVLYTNASGTTEDITINSSVENYKCVEIFYGCDDMYYNTGKIYDPNNKQVGLITPYISNTTDGRAYMYVSNWKFEGTKFKFLKAANKYLTEGNNVSMFGTYSYIRIYKIIGYK